MIKKISSSIRQWWAGKYISDNHSNEYFTFLGYYERHWTSQAAHAIWEFLKKEWRWAIPVCLTFSSVCIALWRLQ
jgi:hypothetical protein